MKEVLLWLVCWVYRAGTRDFCLVLSALVDLVQESFFPRRTLFQLICPHRPPQTGQAVVLGCLTLSMCL